MPTAIGSCLIVAVLKPWLCDFLFFTSFTVCPTMLLGHPERLLGQRLLGSIFLHHFKGQGVGHILVSSPTFPAVTQKKPPFVMGFYKSEIREFLLREDMAEMVTFGKG